MGSKLKSDRQHSPSNDCMEIIYGTSLPVFKCCANTNKNTVITIFRQTQPEPRLTSKHTRTTNLPVGTEGVNTQWIVYLQLCLRFHHIKWTKFSYTTPIQNEMLPMSSASLLNITNRKPKAIPCNGLWQSSPTPHHTPHPTIYPLKEVRETTWHSYVDTGFLILLLCIQKKTSNTFIVNARWGITTINVHCIPSTTN